MGRRGNPEADTQRGIVAVLRIVLPRCAIVHHSANEVGAGGPSARQRQAILVGMGVFPGFSDLIVISEGRVIFLEVKSKTVRLRPSQEAFRDLVEAQGLPWALVRSQNDALEALQRHGFRLTVRGIAP